MMDGDPQEREREFVRLAAVAREAGMPIERLAAALRALAEAESETRRMLARDVYGIPEELLDDVLRIRLSDLEADDV
jgi:hypothetical protein